MEISGIEAAILHMVALVDEDSDMCLLCLSTGTGLNHLKTITSCKYISNLGGCSNADSWSHPQGFWVWGMAWESVFACAPGDSGPVGGEHISAALLSPI